MTTAAPGKSALPYHPGKRQIDSLTGLRICAAAWVVLFHFREVNPGQPWEYPFVDWLVRNGGDGVTLFFVLSGFILSHVYFDTFRAKASIPAFRSFILFRFARLYPVHLVTFLMMLALFSAERILGGAGGTDSRFSPVAILSTVTMTQAWIPGVETPNSPSWSISAEWFAYLLFPLLCLIAARIWKPAVVLAVTGLALGLGFEYLLHTHLIHIMACFLVGMAAHQISADVGSQLPNWTGVAVVGVIIALQTSPFGSPLVVQLVVFATLIIALSTGTDWMCRPLSTPVMVYLGEVSYAVYMFHWIARVVVRVGAEKLGIIGQLHPAALIAAYLLVTAAGSVLLYEFVEKPGRRYLRRLDRTKAAPSHEAKTTAERS